MQLTSICYTTFAAIAKANTEVRAARSAKGKCQPDQHYSAAASPRFGSQIGGRGYAILETEEWVWPRESMQLATVVVSLSSSMY